MMFIVFQRSSSRSVVLQYMMAILAKGLRPASQHFSRMNRLHDFGIVFCTPGLLVELNMLYRLGARLANLGLGSADAEHLKCV